ncbi:hypothetical protein D7Y55_06100 [Stenotrophomonas maltophilia]|nr:hypothetical protein [Stenotrophomonas maltophilia]
MDAAAKPPRVRALCLRSTASQAPERTAASGWAGPRRGGLRRPPQPDPPRQPTDCPLLLRPLLWQLHLRVPGGSPAQAPHPRR